MQNHLSGKKHRFLKLSFVNVSELMDAKSILTPLVQANQKKMKANDSYEDEEEQQQEQRPGDPRSVSGASDPLSYICDMREYDVPYSMRVSIDLDIRVGAWYVVTPLQGTEACEAIWQQDMLELCEPK
jgi:DNA polymerase epsilon subunit 1